MDQKPQISLWLKKTQCWSHSDYGTGQTLILSSQYQLRDWAKYIHQVKQTLRGAGMKMGSLLRGRAALLPLFAHGPQAHLAFVEICGQM